MHFDIASLYSVTLVCCLGPNLLPVFVELKLVVEASQEVEMYGEMDLVISV